MNRKVHVTGNFNCLIEIEDFTRWLHVQSTRGNLSETMPDGDVTADH